MANLDAAADKAVHDAVDAFMEGRLVPDFSGETVFETKHSRYRLRDGVVYAAPSDGLIGAELVGWLMETPRRSVVESAWQPGSRAVLVDRNRGRNIIVTSSTRLLHLEEAMARSHTPPAARVPVDTRPERTPTGARIGREIFAATPMPPQLTSIPQVPVPVAPSTVGGPRRPMVHLPPRPIGPRAGVAMGHPAGAPQTPPGAGMGNPPPAQDIVQPPSEPPPAQEVPWELTSSEIELEDYDSEDADELTLPGNSPRDVPTAPESGAGAPIPLVRSRR